MTLMKQKKIVIFLLIILLLIPISFIALNISNIKENRYHFIIEIDKENVKTYELFNLTIIPVISNINVTWNFGNGDVAYGKNIDYFYIYSDEYLITANISYPDGKDEIIHIITVINQDLKAISVNDGFRTLIPFLTITHITGSRIEQGITNPTINIEIKYKGTGIMGPIVELQDEISNDVILISEYTENVINAEKTYTTTINNDQYNYNESSFIIQGGVQLENGMIDYWIIEIEILY